MGPARQSAPLQALTRLSIILHCTVVKSLRCQFFYLQYKRGSKILIERRRVESNQTYFLDQLDEAAPKMALSSCAGELNFWFRKSVVVVGAVGGGGAAGGRRRRRRRVKGEGPRWSWKWRTYKNFVCHRNAAVDKNVPSMGALRAAPASLGPSAQNFWSKRSFPRPWWTLDTTVECRPVGGHVYRLALLL